MKKISILASALFLLVILSSTAFALPLATLDVGVALPMPAGSFGDAAKAGIGVGADAFFGLPMIPIKVGGHAAYNRFNNKGPGSNTFTIIEILPSIRYSILSIGVADIFAQVGVGYYQLQRLGSKSQNKLGFNIGPGASVMFIPGMRLFVMPLYNLIKTENENTSYLSVNLGLRF